MPAYDPKGSTVRPQSGDTLATMQIRQTVAIARIHDACGPQGDGGDYFADTANHTGGSWRAIKAHVNTVIATATSPTISGTLTNVNLVAGDIWYGHFTQ